MKPSDFDQKQQYFTELYDTRYSSKTREEQERIWQVLCRDYFNRLVPQREQGVMVDIAAGYCNFINNITAQNYKKYAVDLNDAITRQAKPGVTPIVTDVTQIGEHFEKESVDLFMQSHFLEHLPKDTILELIKTEYDLLKPQGEMWILTPNIRYYKGSFWDWYDHITPLTERSLIEVCIMHGFKVKYVVPKFIPGSQKYTKKPTNSWIISLYLKLMPLSGWFFGTQSFIIMQKP